MVVEELIPESLFDYGFVILSAIYAFIAILVYRYYRSSKQGLPYLLLVIAFVLDFAANVAWLFSVMYYGGADSIPYPNFMDVMWLVYYGLFIAGVTYYSVNVWRTFNKGLPYEWFVILGMVFSIIIVLSVPLLQAIGALFNIIIDPLYVALTITLAVACVPLVRLFQGGKLAKPWLFMFYAGIVYAIAETSWIIEFSLSFGHLFSNIVYVAGYVLVIVSLFKTFKSLKHE